MNSGKVVLGTLAGVAAGAALGILFAPDKGSATRKKITQKGNDYANELGQKVNGYVDKASSKFESLKQDASNKFDNLKQDASTMASNALDSGKSKLEKADAEVSTAYNNNTRR